MKKTTSEAKYGSRNPQNTTQGFYRVFLVDKSLIWQKKKKKIISQLVHSSKDGRPSLTKSCLEE